MDDLPAGFRVLDQGQAEDLPPGFRIVTPTERSTGTQIARTIDLGSKGVTDSILETVGAVPDLVSGTMRSAGLGTPEYGYYSDKLKEARDWIARTATAPFSGVLPSIGAAELKPENRLEKAVYGGGRGIGDALSVAMPAAAVANSAKAGSVLQGSAKALAAQPGLQVASGATGGAVGEATDSPLLGLLASLGVPLTVGAARAAVSPVRSQLTGEQARLAQIAADEGIGLTAAQRTGSRPLQTLESVFGTTPLTAGPQQQIRDAQRSQFNKAVLSRAGIEADKATPDVLASAKERLGKSFEDLSAQTTVNLDNLFGNQMAEVAGRYGSKLPSQQKQVFLSYVDDIQQVGPQMDGRLYQTTRSDLTRQYKAISNSDPSLSHALKGLRDALDDAAGRSISPELQSSWNETRRQYGNYKTIERAMTNGTTDALAGNIQPTQLAQAVRQGGRNTYATGGGDLNDIARVGNTFIRDQVPNSGTAERSLIANLITAGTVGGGGIAAGADPMLMAGLTGAGMLLPRVAQAVYNSPVAQRYLTNQAAANMGGPRATRESLAALLMQRPSALIGN